MAVLIYKKILVGLTLIITASSLILANKHYHQKLETIAENSRKASAVVVREETLVNNFMKDTTWVSYGMVDQLIEGKVLLQPSFLKNVGMELKGDLEGTIKIAKKSE
ncbi:hypothetical protein [Litchfieldia salsa]|uniref:hypothetical protein n=1 Tax=Litchfieldia salsa TaxID=930152 RepID=UPI000B857B09|nr:hypothetical protein [Litchfieldia salsa]